jgi:D-3-phosphoglycerate dehydrogenase
VRPEFFWGDAHDFQADWRWDFVINKNQVAILATMSQEAFDRANEILRDGGCQVVTGPSFAPTIRNLPYPENELLELAAGADVLFTAGSRARINAQVLRAATRLRGIVTSSLGYNTIDIGACTQMGILVSNSPVETNYEGVLQHTLLLILALKRRLAFFQNWARSGQPWSPMEIAQIPELLEPGTTVGIVGFGRIGYRVARLFKQSFRTRVVVYDPYSPEDKAEQIGVEMVDDLDQLLRVSDIVTVHVFLSDETTHLIGARELRLMKSTALLVNTSRGPVVDERALIEALQSHQIAGAGLDVAEVEPMDTASPLLKMDNVIVTPHLAGGSQLHTIRGTEFAARSALRLVAARVPRVVVNPEAIAKWATRFDAPQARYGGTVYYRPVRQPQPEGTSAAAP